MIIFSEPVEVGTDHHGISSSSLRSILENWPAGKPKPKILYTVPVRMFTSDKKFFPLNRSTVWM